MLFFRAFVVKKFRFKPFKTAEVKKKSKHIFYLKKQLNYVILLSVEIYRKKVRK